MKRTDYHKDRDRLRELGFTVQEIKRLSALRTHYSEQARDQKTVATSPSQDTTWFERTIRKLLDSCRLLVFSEDCFWPGD